MCNSWLVPSYSLLVSVTRHHELVSQDCLFLAACVRYFTCEWDMKVGTDDDGYPVRLSLQDFLLYMHDPEHSQDDSPLYIFDGSFAEKKGSRAMQHDYQMPSLFNEDLMKYASEKRRPPYRWGRGVKGTSIALVNLCLYEWLWWKTFHR